jgi:Tfp pilus assembly protein PilE
VGDSAKTKKQGAWGFTFVELIITIAAGSIVILGVYRLLTQSLWSYNLQEQMTDMNQNATYTIKKLTEVLSQAGSDLPDSGYPVISVANGHDVTVKTNDKGAKQIMSTSLLSSAKIPVDNGAPFVGCDTIVVDSGSGILKYPLDSVRAVASPDTVYLKSPAVVTLKQWDRVYGAFTERYYSNNLNFCYNTDDVVLAENIDSIAITFYDTSHTATTNWGQMSSGSVYVRARTLSPDKFYKHPKFKDGYRRLALTMDFRLRNKFSY